MFLKVSGVIEVVVGGLNAARDLQRTAENLGEF
jgi:hypothetical protein